MVGLGGPDLPAGFDPTDPDLYARRVPHRGLAELRATAPVWSVEQQGSVGGFDDGGYWAVSRHAHVKSRAGCARGG